MNICDLSTNPYFKNDAIASQSLSNIQNESLRNRIAAAAKKSHLTVRAKCFASNEMKKPIENIPFADRKKNLLKDLKISFISSGIFFPDYRFKKLESSCTKADSEGAIKDLLEKARGQIKQKDKFSNLIDCHLVYFNQAVKETPSESKALTP